MDTLIQYAMTIEPDRRAEKRWIIFGDDDIDDIEWNVALHPTLIQNYYNLYEVYYLVL